VKTTGIDWVAFFGSEGKVRGDSDNGFDVQADELGGETGDPIGPAVCDSPFNAQVLAFDVAVLPEAVPQGIVRL